MPRGSKPGERRGGRQKGAANKRTREIANQAAASGITPLEVMLKAMRVHANARRWDKAAAVAKDAAPYMHPRLASMQHSGPNGGPIPIADLTHATEEQLAALESVFGPLAGSGRDDGGDSSGEGPTGG